MATAAASMPVLRAVASLPDMWAQGYTCLAARMSSTSTLRDMLQQLQKVAQKTAAPGCSMQVGDLKLEPSAVEADAVVACQPHCTGPRGKRKQSGVATTATRKRARAGCSHQHEQQTQVLDESSVKGCSQGQGNPKPPTTMHQAEAGHTLQTIGPDLEKAHSMASRRQQQSMPCASIGGTVVAPATAQVNSSGYDAMSIGETMQAEQHMGTEAVGQPATTALAQEIVKGMATRCNTGCSMLVAKQSVVGKPATPDVQQPRAHATPVDAVAHTEQLARLQPSPQMQLNQGQRSSSSGAAGLLVTSEHKHSQRTAPLSPQKHGTAACGDSVQVHALQPVDASNGQQHLKLVLEDSMPLGEQGTSTLLPPPSQQHGDADVDADTFTVRPGSPSGPSLMQLHKEAQPIQPSQLVASRSATIHPAAAASTAAAPVQRVSTGTELSAMTGDGVSVDGKLAPCSLLPCSVNLPNGATMTCRAVASGNWAQPCSLNNNSAASGADCGVGDKQSNCSAQVPEAPRSTFEHISESMIAMPVVVQNAAVAVPNVALQAASPKVGSAATDAAAPQVCSTAACDALAASNDSSMAAVKPSNLVASVRSFLPRTKPAPPQIAAGPTAASKGKPYMSQRDEGGNKVPAAGKVGGLPQPTNLGGIVRAKVAMFQSSKQLIEEHGKATRVPEKSMTINMPTVHHGAGVDSNRLAVIREASTTAAAIEANVVVKKPNVPSAAAAQSGNSAITAVATAAEPSSQAGVRQAAATASAEGNSHKTKERAGQENATLSEHADRAQTAATVPAAPAQPHREVKPKQDLEAKQRRAEQRRKDEEDRRLAELQQRCKAKEERSRQALQQHVVTTGGSNNAGTTGAHQNQEGVQATGPSALRAKRLAGLMAAASTAVQAQATSKAAAAVPQDKDPQIARPAAAIATAASGNVSGTVAKPTPATVVGGQPSATLSQAASAATASASNAAASLGMPTHEQPAASNAAAPPSVAGTTGTKPDTASNGQRVAIAFPAHSLQASGAAVAGSHCFGTVKSDSISMSAAAETPRVAQQAAASYKGDYEDEQEYQNVQALIKSPYVNPGPHHSASAKHPISYAMTPWKHSDDDDSDASPRGGARKPIPAWAKPEQLVPAVAAQAQRDPDEVFGMQPSTCNLTVIFKGMPPVDPSKRASGTKRVDYSKRGSSGYWLADTATHQEEVRYKRAMGFCSHGVH